MCGIAGEWLRDGETGADRISRTLERLGHRGPDDRGSTSLRSDRGTLVFVHTRLSIIDLSNGGHQPVQTTDGRFTMVYNGEIYNYLELRRELSAAGYEFHTDSDTEVLLAAWAIWRMEALRRLTGMFAFAVHDALEQTLTCVRDPFGIKPLYYRQGQEKFAFASEPGALQELTGDRFAPDLQRTYDYVVHGICGGNDRTFFDGIRQLEPGHLLQCDLSDGTGRIERWWYPAIAERTDLSFAEAADELRERFLANVRLHLRSDVPIGSALSGGIDSSAVVCAIRKLDQSVPIHTFTYVARGSEKDEEGWADIVNAHVGATPHKVVVTPAELARDLDDMIRAQGEPFGSTSIYAQYRVYRLARESGIKVTLDGQGADEVLAGYAGYPEDRVHSLAERWAFLDAFGYSARWPGRRLWPHFIAKLLPSWARRVIPGRFKNALVGYRQPEALGFIREDRLDGVQRGFLPVPDADGLRGRRLVARMRQELMRTSIPHLLRYADRNSMRWSIEGRVPFLTADLAEFLLALPESHHVSADGETKRVLRAAMRGIVPDAILDRRDKIGFETPERDWLRALDGVQVDSWVEGLDSIPFVDVVAAKDSVHSIVTGRRPFSWLAWRLINLGRWAQLHA